MNVSPRSALILATLAFTLSITAFAQTPAAPQPAPAPTQDQPATQPAPPPADSTPAPSPAPPAASPAPNNGQPAANPDGTFTIRRTARLVILDTVVVDAKNNVIKDLKREDFHVEEAGEPQTLLNFEAAGSRTPDPSQPIESTADLDRIAPRAPVNIILLDEFNTRFEDMAFARYSLRKFLEKQPGQLPTPTMLIAVDLQHFTVLRDYTRNKDEILSALDKHFSGYPWQAHQGAWIAERYATAFITLRRVSEAVIGHPGHKNMIWIGRGFPSLDFRNVSLDSQTRVNNAVQSCVNSLRDARITLYTIDPAGVMVNPNEYGGGPFNDPFGGNYEFSRLARATGGRTLYGRNDVDAEIGTAIQDGASFYTLTYRPGNDSADPQKFRKIKVTLDRPGLTAITREGYYPRTGPGRVDPQNPSRRLVSDLVSAGTSTMAYDGVPLTLQTSPTDPESFTVHVDARALAWTPATDTEPRHSQVILMVTTFDHKGKELTRDARTITAKAPPTVPPTGRLERNIDLSYKLDHNPKAVRARFVVRVTASGRIGTADIALGPQAASNVKTP